MNNRRQTIDAKYLRTFSHVAKLKSFTAAADYLSMTQPAVSQQIKRIEQILGASVFKRKEGFTLTKHGQVLLQYAQKASVLNDALYEQLLHLDTTGVIQIAIDCTIGQELIDHIVESIGGLNNVELSFTSINDESWLKEKFDLIFCLQPLSGSIGKTYRLKPVSYVLATHRTLKRSVSDISKVIHCRSLARTEVENLLSEAHIDTSKIETWVATNACGLASYQSVRVNTVVVCPASSACYLTGQKRFIDKHMNWFMWSRYGQEFGSSNQVLTEMINKLLISHSS